MKRTKDVIVEEFFAVVTSLEPENLHMDGEATHTQVNNKVAECQARWETLEAEIGHTVSEDDAMIWYMNKESR